MYVYTCLNMYTYVQMYMSADAVGELLPAKPRREQECLALNPRFHGTVLDRNIRV